MFFENRGKKILCRRVTYVPGGKNKTETIVSIDQGTTVLTDEVKGKLKTDEVTLLQALLDEHAKVNAKALNEAYLLTLGRDLERSIAAVQDSESAKKLTESQVAKIWEGLDEMRRAMRKAGHHKPKSVDD